MIKDKWKKKLCAVFAAAMTAGITVNATALPALAAGTAVASGNRSSEGTTTESDEGTTTESDEGTTTEPDEGTTTESGNSSTGSSSSGNTNSSSDSGTTTENDGNEGTVKTADPKEAYLSLGADLTDSQKATVLKLLGVKDISDFDSDHLITVTNKEEHEYLSSYVSSSTIGTRALSSVLVTKADDGNGIKVATRNITYCTPGMYENALATAGAKDVNVVVAGPFKISGTAALVGAIKTYSKKTDTKVSDKTVDAAVNEMVTTGQLENEVTDKKTGKSVPNESVEGMIAWLKSEMAKGNTRNLDQTIDQGEQNFHITLTDEQQQQLKEMLEKLNNIDLNTSSLKQQADSAYSKLKDLNINFSLNSAQAEGFFAKIAAWFRSLFQ